MPRLKGVYDFIRQPLYDTVGATALAMPQLTFFQNAIGQGVGNFGAATQPKTKADTNMTLQGQIPAGYGQLVQGFRLALPWNVVNADFVALLNGCVFEFSVASKAFLTVPARTVPAGNGPFGNVTGLATNGFPSMSNLFGLGEDTLPIEASMNFNVTLTWPGTVPTITQTGFAPTASIPITVYLDGRQGRPVQ